MTENNTAIKVRHLTKTFRIPLEAHSGLKQKLINGIKGRKGYREFTPLNDVSFEIQKGEFFGIVGRNGSGKSTLLKSIAGIYTPTRGGVKVNGKLVPFIELGVGFNPELTGRENVFLNGALLGFSNKEMEVMYEEIVEFAELHDFMEERLKNYSSGMQVRLAFSIAIRAEGDILLLDEVLAVGDEAFQRKCYDYFYKLKQDKKTVVLVTHNMSAVESFCTSALFLDEGRIKKIGNTHDIAAIYTRANSELDSNDTNQGSHQFLTRLSNRKGVETNHFSAGEEIIIDVEWKQQGVNNIGIAILSYSGAVVYATNTFIEKQSFKDRHSASYRARLTIGEGSYYVKVGLFGSNDMIKIAFDEDAGRILVSNEMKSYQWEGVVELDHTWEMRGDR